MALPLVNVTVTLRDLSGQPVSGATVEAVLASHEVYEGYVVPSGATAETDAEGVAVLALFPSELGSRGSTYTFRVTPSVPGEMAALTFTDVSVPNRDCALEDIAELAAYPATYWSGKADKVEGGTSGHFAALDAEGNLVDSGYAPGDFSGGDMVEAVFSYGDATPKTLTTLPAGRAVLAVALVLTTAFDGAGAMLSVGDAAAHGRLMAASENDPGVVATYEATPGHVYATETAVNLYITPGDGASAGAGIVRLVVQR